MDLPPGAAGAIFSKFPFGSWVPLLVDGKPCYRHSVDEPLVFVRLYLPEPSGIHSSELKTSRPSLRGARSCGSFWPFCGAAVLILPAPLCLAADTSSLDGFRALVFFPSWFANRPVAATPRSFSACCRTASDSGALRLVKANNSAHGPSSPAAVVSSSATSSQSSSATLAVATGSPSCRRSRPATSVPRSIGNRWQLSRVIFTACLPLDLRQQNLSPTFGAVHIAWPQLGCQTVALSIEQQQRVIAGGLEVPVVSALLLLSIHRDFGGIHVEHGP